MKKTIALMLALLTLMALLTGCKEEQLPPEGNPDNPPSVFVPDPTPNPDPTPAPNPDPTPAPTPDPVTPADPNAVTFQPVKEVVYATTVVNVRSKPTTEGSEKLGKLTAGQGVTRTGIGSNGWDEVNYKGETAYIKSEYLTTKKPDAPTPTPEPSNDVKFEQVNETVYVKTAGGTLRVRSLPSTDGSALGALKNGASVIRTGIGDNGWSRIMFEGAEAYVKTDYLTTTAP